MSAGNDVRATTEQTEPRKVPAEGYNARASRQFDLNREEETRRCDQCAEHPFFCECREAERP